MRILTERNDFRDLVLGDGETRADSLRGHVLFRELTKLKVPGIAAEDGKLALLRKYRAHVEAVAEDLRGPAQSGTMRPKELNQTIMRQAAELIGRNGRAWMAEDDQPPSNAPKRPIASTRIAS